MYRRLPLNCRNRRKYPANFGKWLKRDVFPILRIWNALRQHLAIIDHEPNRNCAARPLPTLHHSSFCAYQLLMNDGVEVFGCYLTLEAKLPCVKGVQQWIGDMLGVITMTSLLRHASMKMLT